MFWILMGVLSFEQVWAAAQHGPSGRLPALDLQTARVSFVQNLLGFLPWGNLSLRYTSAFTPPTSFPLPVTPDRFYSHVLSLQAVLFSPAWLDGLVEARGRWVRALWDYRLSRYRLLVDVAQAYAEAWQAQEVLKLRAARVRQAQKALEEVEARQALQAASRLDVLNARYAYLQARTRVEQALHEWTAARSRLASLVGWEDLGDSLAPPPDTLEVAFPDPHRYPAVVGASRGAFYAGIQKVLGWVAWLPEVTFEWSWSRSAFSLPSPSELTRDQKFVQGWSVSLNVSLDRYLFGVVQRHLSHARARQEARQAYLEAVEARRALEAEARALEAEGREVEEALRVAREAEALARRRYTLGDLPLTEWLEAQARLSEAMEQWVRWRARRFVHRVRRMWEGTDRTGEEP